MTVYEFLRSVAEQLGDAMPGREFRRYTLNNLLHYYNEAMCFVATHRPDLFTDFLVMKLETGTDQDARCCGCTSITGVVAQLDADGNIVKDLSENGSSTVKTGRWYRPLCRSAAGATADVILMSYAMVPGMPGRFTVNPPVPPGVDVWVKVKCVHAAPSLSEAQVLDIAASATTGDCKFLPAARSLVLWRALEGDIHASGSASVSQAEFKNAVALLGIEYKFAKEIGAS